MAQWWLVMTIKIEAKEFKLIRSSFTEIAKRIHRIRRARKYEEKKILMKFAERLIIIHVEIGPR